MTEVDYDVEPQPGSVGCALSPCGRPNCRVCWWETQRQPETLLDQRARHERARRAARLHAFMSARVEDLL